MSIRKLLTRLSRDENAISAVEYGLILGLIVLVMVTAMSGFANVTLANWNNISTQTASAVSNATAS